MPDETDASHAADTSENSASDNSRREFLTGKAVRDRIRDTGDKIADAVTDTRPVPQGTSTLRLSQRAMACEFTAVLAPDRHDVLPFVSDALRLLEPLEAQMTIYRETSELSLLNAAAADQPMVVEAELYQLLKRAVEVSHATGGAFDPTSGPLVKLWSACRAAGRVPTDGEIQSCLSIVGADHVHFNDAEHTVEFDAAGIELNLGGIGKGYALDRIAGEMQGKDLDAFLLHGGYSSILAVGDHNETGGWPVGIGNPLFTDRRMGTLLLKDKAMSTSGSNIQYYRVGGKRYGHILDPRTGWPIENLLSVTVLANTAAEADALSTAFFVMGLENARSCCDTLDGVGIIMIPFPEGGRKVTPTVIGTSDDVLYWDYDQVQ